MTTSLPAQSASTPAADAKFKFWSWIVLMLWAAWLIAMIAMCLPVLSTPRTEEPAPQQEAPEAA